MRKKIEKEDEETMSVEDIKANFNIIFAILSEQFINDYPELTPKEISEWVNALFDLKRLAHGLED